MRDDLVGRPTVEGVSIGPVLREADPMAPPVPGDEDRRKRLPSRRVLRARIPVQRRGDVALRRTGEPEGGENGCCELLTIGLSVGGAGEFSRPAASQR